MSTSGNPLNFDTFNIDAMSPAEFEEHLPELFTSGGGRVSDDPRFQIFFSKNPDCEALVRDLETIAETARQLLEPTTEEPSDSVWDRLQDKLKLPASGEEIA